MKACGRRRGGLDGGEVAYMSTCTFAVSLSPRDTVPPPRRIVVSPCGEGCAAFGRHDSVRVIMNADFESTIREGIGGAQS